jgi:hypothetical protein
MRPLSFFSVLLTGSSLANSSTVHDSYLGADPESFTISQLYIDGDGWSVLGANWLFSSAFGLVGFLKR